MPRLSPATLLRRKVAAVLDEATARGFPVGGFTVEIDGEAARVTVLTEKAAAIERDPFDEWKAKQGRRP